MMNVHSVNQSHRVVVSQQHTNPVQYRVGQQPTQKLMNSNPYDLLEKSLQNKIDALNQELEPSHGPNHLQEAYAQGIDVSPEATAGRITQFATHFFSSFQQQHPELSEAEAKIEFHAIISSAIDTGFQEAKDILSGMQVLEGEIAENIDKTYDIVQEQLAQWLDSE